MHQAYIFSRLVVFHLLINIDKKIDMQNDKHTVEISDSKVKGQCSDSDVKMHRGQPRLWARLILRGSSIVCCLTITRRSKLQVRGVSLCIGPNLNSINSQSPSSYDHKFSPYQLLGPSTSSLRRISHRMQRFLHKKEHRNIHIIGNAPPQNKGTYMFLGN